MKIWLTSDNVDWDASRYHYAAEQMLLTLFPGERPEYPETEAPTSLAAEPNAVIFTLHRGAKLTNMSALLLRDGKWNNGVVRFPSEKLDEDDYDVYHTVQHALKMAFYKAGTALLGRDLPWGAMTGVRPVKVPTKILLSGGTPAQAERELRDEYRVSPPRRRLALDCARQSVAARRSLKSDEVSLYVGIPFCPTRCAYCSFISADVGRCLELVEPYLEALFREIAGAGEVLGELGLHVRTIYIGGGTPTTLSAPQLDALMGTLGEKLDLSRLTEYTVEAGRPDTITAEKLAALKKNGCGRVSVNPQSMDDKVLAAMGRAHTAADIDRAMELVRVAGFGAVNMDLIAGLPADSTEGFRSSLDQVLALGPENITVHTLALKRGSRLLTEENPYPLPSTDQVAAMLDYAGEALRGAGYGPYYLYRQKYMSGSFENVGWALPGQENLYNIAMMEELHTVLALGGGGVTKLVGGGGERILRIANAKYPYEYIQSIQTCLAEKRQIITFYQGGSQWHTN